MRPAAPELVRISAQQLAREGWMDRLFGPPFGGRKDQSFLLCTCCKWSSFFSCMCSPLEVTDKKGTGFSVAVRPVRWFRPGKGGVVVQRFYDKSGIEFSLTDKIWQHHDQSVV